MSSFYKKSADYWSNIPATIDGVLGGFGFISSIDIEGSRKFLDSILSLRNTGTKLALDCGAGIGRVTENVLFPIFNKVDLVEQNEKFIDETKLLLGKSPKLGTLYNVSLQDFEPEHTYDVIWIQWVLGYVNDYDLVEFLTKCKESLAGNGLIIIKDNIGTTAEREFDEDDGSVTRPVELMEMIFDHAKLRVIRTEVECNFPEELYPVHTFALVPKEDFADVIIV